MSEISLHSNLNRTSFLKPAWSFMSLHSKHPSTTSSKNPADASQKDLALGRQPRFKSSGISGNAKDVSESQSSDDRLHILESAPTKLMPDVEFHERKTAGVVGQHTPFSSDTLASTSSHSVRDNALRTTGLLSYNSEQTKGRNSTAASRLRPESPAVEKYINDRQTPRAFSSIPYSEDSDNKMDTTETILAVKRDEMSSDDFNGRGSQDELRPRGVSLSNGHPTDQNGMHTLVLEAMKTIQRYELENEKQRQELNRLGTVISDLQSEKQRLVDKVATLKKTTIQKVAASSQALKDQGEELRALKLRSEELFATTGDCRALLQEIHQLKGTISESIESVRGYLNPEHCIDMRDNDPILPLGAATREILSALKNEVQNKQQVLDMLRDRLSDALSDVAVLRTHAFQMQEAYSAECLALKVAKEEQNMRDTRVSELLDELNNERKESLKALAQAAELELKHQNLQQQHMELDSIQKTLQVEMDLRLEAEKRIIEQNAIIQTQKTSLEFLEKIKNENFQLSSDLASQTERLKLLDTSQIMVKTLSDENESLRNEGISRNLTIREYEVKLASLEDLSAKSEKEIEEQKSTINELRTAVSSNEKVISDLKNSVLSYQDKVNRIECLLTQANKELSTSLEKAAVIAESEKALQTQCLEATKEKEALTLKLKETSQKLEQALAMKDQEIQTKMQNQSKSFQEQFEDQNTTLRLVREANADLQERLLSTVAEHTKKLEETRGNSRRDIAILEERNASLHSLLEREKESISRLQARLAQRELEIEQHVKESKQRPELLYLRLHQDLQSLQEQKSSLETQLHQEKAMYQARCSEFQIKEAEHLREINELHTDLDLRTQYEHEMKERYDQEQLESRSQIELLQTRLSDSEKNNSPPFACFEHEQEIHRLRAHIHQLQAENEMVRDRMITLSRRYDSGDLDVAERTLVQKIMKGIQAVHDQEIAKLKNELHRKDGLIASLEDIKTTLENSLKKRLQKKSPLTGTNTFETSDFINWPSSPPVYSAATTNLGKQMDGLKKTPPGESQDGTLLYSASRQPGNKNSPLNTTPITVLQESNNVLELGDVATPGSNSGTIALETQRPLPKRPKTAGRNTQTYSSKNKRKRRN